MSSIVDQSQNPYAPPACIEPEQPTIHQRMNALRSEYEYRYAQLVSDGIMATEFSVVCGLLAWRLSENPACTAAAAVVPAVAIGIEAIRDLCSKTARFSARMEELREESHREWLRHMRNL